MDLATIEGKSVLYACCSTPIIIPSTKFSGEGTPGHPEGDHAPTLGKLPDYRLVAIFITIFWNISGLQFSISFVQPKERQEGQRSKVT